MKLMGDNCWVVCDECLGVGCWVMMIAYCLSDRY